MKRDAERSLRFRCGGTHRDLQRRRFAGVASGCALLLNIGCYTYHPLNGVAPQPGERVSLQLTDQGRVALGDQLGPGVLVVEGTLQSMENGQYVLGVSRVATISGGTANWGGERIRVPAADVAQSGIRTLSTARSALLAGAVVVGLGVLFLTQGLNTGGVLATQDTSGLGGQQHKS